MNDHCHEHNMPKVNGQCFHCKLEEVKERRREEFNDIVADRRAEAVENIIALLTGATSSYESIHQILDEFAYQVKHIVEEYIT